VTQTLLLQARIYNYSHVDMDAPTLVQKAARVHVRFYGQVFRSDEGEYPEGNSFLIGETTLAPIPGFASTTTPGDPPNWRMATVTFNPSAFAQTRNGNVYLRFWVAAWMEDGSGNLVQEMAGHGLTANPAKSTIHTMGNVRVEPYSNNVGSLKQVFYIQDPNALSPTSAGAVRAGAAPTLTLAADLVVPPVQPAGGLRGKHLLTTTITAGDELQALQLVYFDGDPTQGGQPFDWESVPYIAAGATYVNRVTYTPQQCGRRTVFVVARMGNEEVTASTDAASTQCVWMLPVIWK
jgi:hypothetical protein